MKKIKLYIAASIDGYIARNDGDLDWLMKYPINSETNYGYDDFYILIENIVEEISKLREEKGQDIWLVGGGQLITMLLNQDMVDEMIITTIPVLLGNGIPLFPDSPKELEWKLQDCRSYENGIVQIVYKKK